MSTTRHLINRQRRLAAVRPPVQPTPDLTQQPVLAQRRAPGRAWRRPVLPALAVLTVLAGGFGAWAVTHAAELRSGPAVHNSALADPARTSEVKGAVAQAVNTLFSYNYADTARTDAAAKTLLVGKAVQQYAAMLAQVHQQAPQQKLVLTTTVTDSGVEQLDGDRARLLLFADQRNTSTAGTAGTAGTATAGAAGKADASTYAAAMFAVDAVREGGSWRIANIDTFNQ